MTDTTIVAVPHSDSPASVDWAAVIGGALLASALSFVLFAFGSAAGVASVSPYSYNNPSATTLSIISAAWVIVVMIGSFLAGGYFAGRLRRAYADGGPSERETRDGAHGLLVWALGLLIGATLAFMAASATVRGAASVAAQAGGTAVGAAGAAATALPADRITGFVDTMLRAAPRRGDAAQRTEDPRAEIARVIGGALSRGQVTEEDRVYVAQLVAARTGVPEEEARRRVDAGIAQANQAIEQAKQAADKARKLAAILAFLIGAASILSAAAAYWAAGCGGRCRDESHQLRRA